jgi:hypothetical protein
MSSKKIPLNVGLISIPRFLVSNDMVLLSVIASAAFALIDARHNDSKIIGFIFVLLVRQKRGNKYFLSPL